MKSITVAQRFLILSRTMGAPVEVLGPRTVRLPTVYSRPGLESTLHILRQRAIDRGDRLLLVSKQAAAYRVIGSSTHICPVCYARAEDKLIADSRSHYPLMHAQLHHPVDCNSCGSTITREERHHVS